MSTTLDIDQNLLQEVLKQTGIKTPSEAVEAALKALLKLSNQKVDSKTASRNF